MIKVRGLSTISSGILLKRSPILTRTLDPFSASYLAHRLQEQSHLPFVPEFYFKKGSTAEQKWHAAQSNGDELVQVEEEVTLVPRESPADEDVKSLDRLRERTLFLIVQAPQSKSWKLLSGPLEKEDECLDQGADRIVRETMGDQMDVWRVGKAPVGHLETPHHKTYFMKYHLLPGSKPKWNTQKISEYAWLTKQECETFLEKEYYESVKDMMSDY